MAPCSAILLVLTATAFTLATAPDPSGSWLSYAKFDANGKRITAMNLTTVVPENPLRVGADPSFWYGLQTDKGTGALIQPILAWGQLMEKGWGIFHEVFDWNNEHDSRSPEAYTVLPGDTLTQSVVYVPTNNSYTMYIASARSGKSIVWNYKLEPKQGDTPESTAYIVVEHQPTSCDMFPTNGNITFSSIVIEVEDKIVTNPTWVVQQERPACNSKAVVVDESTVMLHWSSKPAAVV